MRTILVASAFALALAWPAPARADVFLTPYAGVNFAGSTIDKRTNVGASLTWLGSSGLGVEVDMGFIPDFFAPKDLDLDLLGDNSVTTLMGNIVFGRGGGGIQPYVSAGAGLMRSQVGSFGEFFDATDNGFGVNAGAGVRVGGGRLSLRGDVRYFRNISDVDETILEDVLGDFSFWRATAGLSLRF
jgi:Outer membrane protein beta-barrel domain